MNQSLPSAHPDAAVEATRPYITSVVLALIGRGVAIYGSWLDPNAPRDATIQFLRDIPGTGASESSRTLDALVWDEETGWRCGSFVSGGPGVRTVLARAEALGGGLLPPGDEVADRILSGASAEPQVFRRWFDVDDGFAELLRQAGEGVLLPG
jgi:hypothetical protein